MNKRIILILILLPGLFLGSFAEELKTVSGDVVTGEIVEFDGESFKLESGDTFPRTSLKQISFVDIKKQDTKSVSERYPFNPREFKKYFQDARLMLNKHPGAYGIIIKDEGEEILRPDGTRYYRYHFVGYIAKEQAKDWAQRVVWEEKDTYTSKILLARTITPDLEVLNYDPETVEIVKTESEDWSFGDRDIMKVFSIPGADVGTIVEYAVYYDTHNPSDKKIFEPNYYFGDDIPVLSSKFTIGIPKERDFSYVTRNFPKSQSNPDIAREDGMVYYTWHLKHVEPYSEELLMPDSGDIVPRLDASAFKDWGYLFEYQRKMLLRRMKPTPEIEVKVKELTEGIDDIEEKIARIYYFIQDEIRYVSIKGSLGSGITGHPAGETFEKRYGDCIDKAVLFSTMLNLIGVESYPVSVNTNDSDRAPIEIPSIYANHAITEVHLNGTIFYLDSTATWYRYPYFRGDDMGIPVVNEIQGKVREIPVMPPEYNWNSYYIEIELEDNGDAVITAKNKYAGDYEAGLKDYYSYYSSDEMRKQIFQRMASETAPGADLEYYKIPEINYEDQFQMEYRYSVPQYPFIANDLFIFNPRARIYNFPEVQKSEREYPIEYTMSQRTDNQVEINYSKSFQVKYLPEKLEIKNEYISFTGEFSTVGNKIIYNDSFKRFKRIIPVKDYAEYRKLLLQIQEFSNDKVILEKKAEVE